MKDKYYVLRGWDVKTGIPTGETLEKSGLDHAANELRELGKLPENRTLEHPRPAIAFLLSILYQ